MQQLLTRPTERTPICTRREWEANMNKRSLSRFFKESWHIIEPASTLSYNWHMDTFCEILTGILMRVLAHQPNKKDTIVNVPPATTKSTIITIAFPVWAWIWEPGLKFITISHDESLALRHAVKSRDIIQSEWFQYYYGHLFRLKYDVNKKSEYQNDHHGHRIAAGIKGSILGKHGDIIIGDDINNPKKVTSQLETQTVNLLWDHIVSTRSTDLRTTARLNVQQRTGKNDLTGHLLRHDPGGYNHICMPARISKDVKPESLKPKYVDGLLDPVRLNEAVLRKQKVRLGSRAYAGQYMQIPVAEEGNLVNPTWYGRFDLIHIGQTAFDADETLTWDFFIDGAYTEKETNAPTAVLCGARIAGKLYIRHVQRVWMELPELIRFIPEYCERNDCSEQSRIFIEPKASGLPAAQMLKKETPLNIILDVAPTTPKEVRLKECLPFLESGRAMLLRDADWMDMYLDEMKTFPHSDYADLVDVTTMAVNRTSGGTQGGAILGMSAV